MSGGIFISYRRDDSAGFAGRIYDRVATRLNRERVFFDVDNIELGVDFVRVLSDRVAECDALVAIIGKDWLSAADEENRRRLDNPDDWVRVEIETALRRNITVIPVLVGGAVMPRKEHLPEELKPLARRQGLEISHAHFDSDAEMLTRALAFVEEARRKREQAAAELEERQRQEAEAARRAEEGRRAAEAEAAQRAEDERRRREEAEAAKQAEEARRAAEAQAAQRAENERRLRAETDAAKLAEEERQRLVAQTALRAEGEMLREHEPKHLEFIESPKPRSRSTKRYVIASVTGVAVVGAAAFIMAGNSLRQSPALVGDFSPAPSHGADSSATALAAPPESPVSQATPIAIKQNPLPTGGSGTVASTVVAAVAPAAAPKSNASAGVDNSPLTKECDRLAADPTDKSRPAGVQGVNFAALDAATAVAACKLALEQFPLSARIRFELGRALMKIWYYDDAFAVMKPAAESGYAPAQDGIGIIYNNKPGAWPDYTDALAWYQKAADQGCAPAQYHVGKLYENGAGVETDIAQAKAWYQRAADQGYEDAHIALERLAK